MTQDKRKSIKKQVVWFLRHQLYWLCWTWQDYKGLFSSEADSELMIRISMLDSMILNEDVEVAEWPTVDEIEGVVHPKEIGWRC